MKTIYISGPITDLTTGQPRDGWQKDFLEAEAKLRVMGFYVINPVDIAREVVDAFRWRFRFYGGPMNSTGEPLQPKRTDYIMACLQRMQMASEAGMLHAVYVIGNIGKARLSHGVGMEMHMAELLDIPIYVDYIEGKRMTWDKNFFVPMSENADITELLKEN
jgi:hypothetical protein